MPDLPRFGFGVRGGSWRAARRSVRVDTARGSLGGGWFVGAWFSFASGAGRCRDSGDWGFSAGGVCGGLVLRAAGDAAFPFPWRVGVRRSGRWGPGDAGRVAVRRGGGGCDSGSGGVVRSVLPWAGGFRGAAGLGRDGGGRAVPGRCGAVPGRCRAGGVRAETPRGFVGGGLSPGVESSWPASDCPTGASGRPGRGVRGWFRGVSGRNRASGREFGRDRRRAMHGNRAKTALESLRAVRGRGCMGFRRGGQEGAFLSGFPTTRFSGSPGDAPRVGRDAGGSGGFGGGAERGAGGGAAAGPVRGNRCSQSGESGAVLRVRRGGGMARRRAECAGRGQKRPCNRSACFRGVVVGVWDAKGLQGRLRGDSRDAPCGVGRRGRGSPCPCLPGVESGGVKGDALSRPPGGTAGRPKAAGSRGRRRGIARAVKGSEIPPLCKHPLLSIK